MRNQPAFNFNDKVMYEGVPLVIIAPPKWGEDTYKYILGHYKGSSGVGRPIAEKELTLFERAEANPITLSTNHQSTINQPIITKI